MRLYTVQTKSVIDEINKNGFYICDESKCENFSDSKFIKAYDWLSKQMESKIGNPENIKYPVWAWYKINGSNELPDFNDPLVNWGNRFLLEIEIPESSVVLSDYESWHYPLNDWYFSMEEEEEACEREHEWFRSLDEEEREEVRLKSWEEIFNIEKSEDIQATFWKLEKENIKNIFNIKKSFFLEDMMDIIKSFKKTGEDKTEFYGYKRDEIPQNIKNYYVNYYARQNIHVNNEDSLDNIINQSNVEIPKDIRNKLEQIIDFYKSGNDLVLSKQ